MRIEDFIKANFSENEYKKAIEFIKSHNKKCFEKYCDVSGALLSYEFIPSGIGCMMTIKCSCGCELNISVFDSL